MPTLHIQQSGLAFGRALIKDVHVPAAHVVVKIKPQFPVHAKAIYSGCRAAYPNRAKQVVVVEDDCDIYDDNDVQWHVATRVQPDRDLTIWEKGTARASAAWSCTRAVNARETDKGRSSQTGRSEGRRR